MLLGIMHNLSGSDIDLVDVFAITQFRRERLLQIVAKTRHCFQIGGFSITYLVEYR